MVVQVNYDDANVRLRDLIDAALRGDKVIIEKDGRQMIELVPIHIRRQRKFGSAKGRIIIPPDFNQPLSDFSSYMT